MRHSIQSLSPAVVATAALVAALLPASLGHGCVQPREPSASRAPAWASRKGGSGETCSGGLCVGMHGDPHEGGPSSYPVGNASAGYTVVSSTMTVPELPKRMDGICYYIWTDIFFGDGGHGRMNQFVPQLLLGEALDGSSGPPLYKPRWGHHATWKFGAHYFFELFNETSRKVTAHAVYGELFEAAAGEVMFTAFKPDADGPYGLSWTLEMGVVGDPSRLSSIRVDQPYMGLGANWDVPTTSWEELNYTNMCINGCWELYGAVDPDHLPTSGSHYDIRIERAPAAAHSFEWISRWDTVAGNHKCPASTISEQHNDTVQRILWDVSLPPSRDESVENLISV